MIKTITEYFKDRLVSILSEYLKDFSHSNISEVNHLGNFQLTKLAESWDKFQCYSSKSRNPK